MALLECLYSCLFSLLDIVRKTAPTIAGGSPKTGRTFRDAVGQGVDLPKEQRLPKFRDVRKEVVSEDLQARVWFAFNRPYGASLNLDGKCRHGLHGFTAVLR
jgi:hypothetical protein